LLVFGVDAVVVTRFPEPGLEAQERFAFFRCSLRLLVVVGDHVREVFEHELWGGVLGGGNVTNPKIHIFILRLGVVIHHHPVQVFNFVWLILLGYRLSRKFNLQFQVFEPVNRPLFFKLFHHGYGIGPRKDFGWRGGYRLLEGQCRGEHCNHALILAAIPKIPMVIVAFSGNGVEVV